MDTNSSLKICFAGGKQAGIIGILTVLSRGNEISAAVSYSEDLTNILNLFNISVYPTINDKKFIKALTDSDILISVHGKEIVNKKLLSLPRLGAINVHPYLYQYKGANPVGRALEDKNFKASIGIHQMSEQVDQGEVLVEEFVDVSGARSIEEIYNKLYPYYTFSLIKALEVIAKK